MYKTNMSLLDRTSLKRVISFIEQLLSSGEPITKDKRLRMITHLKTYQDALGLVEAHLIKTGGTFTITNNHVNIDKELIKLDSVE